MGVIDYVKASLEWKEEYDKKQNTDVYIFRITDLNNKLCEENAELKLKIKELENPDFILSDIHMEILKKMYENNDYLAAEYVNQLVKKIEYDLAFQQLNDNEYIEENSYSYSFPVYKIAEFKRAEVIKKIIEYNQKDGEAK